MSARTMTARQLLPLIRQGKTINRAWMELQLRSAKAEGLTLDLGSGESSYFGTMARGPSARLVRVDVDPGAKPHLVANLEEALPFATSSADRVLLLNVLEHVYHYQLLLREIGRVLRSGGHLVMFSPFLIAVHTARRDPQGSFTDDYFRFSSSRLRRLVTDESGFGGPIDIRPCAFGPFTAGLNLVIPGLRWGTVKAAAAACALQLDILLAFRRGASEGASRSEWAIGYYVDAVK
jgi:SAM-dependent methyltransferase